MRLIQIQHCCLADDGQVYYRTVGRLGASGPEWQEQRNRGSSAAPVLGDPIEDKALLQSLETQWERTQRKGHT